MSSVTLSYVRSTQDIHGSLETFNREFHQNPDLARDLLRQTWYWVYDPGTKTFGPSKFVGFRSMNFDDYTAARKGIRSGDRFDGGATHRAIEKLLGSYAQDMQLALELIRWGQTLSGTDVFDGVNETKWRFVSL